MQWCHGAPGFIPLLCQYANDSGPAADDPVLRRKCLEAAEKAGNVVWERGLLKKVGVTVLCLVQGGILVQAVDTMVEMVACEQVHLLSPGWSMCLSPTAQVQEILWACRST